MAPSHLKQLDYSIVQQCMHCGLCLPTCPTYDATQLERNSPRGRIALMRAIADGRLEPTRTFAEEMYFCLGCLACMTACPAGVNYAELFERARAEAERSGVLKSPARNWIRGVTLHGHNGEWELAQQLARRNIERFPPEQFNAIITNSGGCGSHLKHYAKLLAGEPAWEARAREWDRKVKDVHEWLVQIGIQRPSPDQPAQNVTYHESCHLCHGQKITTQPRQVLKAIPNLHLVELPESSWCC